MTTLKDTRILLSASRGLGEELAVALARRGAKLVLVARGRNELERVRARILAEGGKCRRHRGGRRGQGGGASHRCAGGGVHSRRRAGWRGRADSQRGHARAVAAGADAGYGLRGPGACVRSERAGTVPPHDGRAGAHGHDEAGLVVAVSSAAAENAYPSWGAYGATKAALEHTMRTFAAETEGSGVRFLVVDPGEMDTRMHSEALPDADRKTLTAPRVAAELLVRAMESKIVGKAGFTRVELGGAS